MEKTLYSALEHAEDSWWYRGRTAAVTSVLKRFSLPHGPVVDIGAGFGAMYPVLHPYGPVSAYEVDEACLGACKSRGYAAVYNSQQQLFSPPAPYAVAAAFDVIEHIEDDHAFMRSLYSAMAPGSYVLATVPAHPYLWSQHDRENHHYRRYTKKTIKELMTSAGFVPLYAGYWNASPFVIAFLLRVINKGGSGGLYPPAFIDRLLRTILSGEAWLLRYIPMPVGLSLIMLAKK